MNLWLGRKNYGTSIFNPDQILTIVCKEYLLYIIFVMLEFMAVAGKQSVIYAYDIYSQSGEMLLLHTAYRVLFAPCYFRPSLFRTVSPRLEFAQTKLWFKRDNISMLFVQS